MTPHGPMTVSVRHATTPLQGVLKTHYTPAAKALPQPGSDDALKRVTATIGVASQRAAKTSPMYEEKRFRARARQIHLYVPGKVGDRKPRFPYHLHAHLAFWRARARRARARAARRGASGAAGRKLSWSGKSWAVAVAGQRPTAARGNRGGVTIHVVTL